MRSHGAHSLVVIVVALGWISGCGSDQANEKRPVLERSNESATSAPESFAPWRGLTASDGDPLTHHQELNGWEKRRWLDKTARALRGRGLGAEEIEQSYEAKRLDFVEGLLERKEFAEVVLDFNLYFLGFKKKAGVRNADGKLAGDWLTYPHALQSARNIATGGDYFALFRWSQPSFIEPAGQASLPASVVKEEGEQVGNLSQTEIRAKLTELAVKEAEELWRLASDTENFAIEKFCERITNSEGSGLLVLPFYAGLPSSLQTSYILSEKWLRNLIVPCFANIATSQAELARTLEGFRDRLPKLFELTETLASETYRIDAITDYRTIDLAEYGFDAQGAFTPTGTLSALPNSSTNFNRKRASYVLKRFFCDDLTPINVAIPENHGEGLHASEPACQACHYKLDPMAGFFKDYGVAGLDFGAADTIIFEDLARVPREEYQKAWRAPEGSGRKWDIGFIRSSTNASVNEYGESMTDLFNIIAKAPEVKKCLVRRMFEYYVGTDQAIDAGYLDYLTRTMISESESLSSGAAYKRTVARLVLGQTFTEPDPVATECYDYAPGQGPEGKPPCQVAFLLERNCASCHSGEGAMAGLDLTGWIRTGDGGMSFPHQKNGQQQSKLATFQALSDRLTTGDLRRRMPLGKDMPNTDREELYLWVDKTLSDLGGN